MILSTLVILPIICLCVIGVRLTSPGADNDIWVWPQTFEDDGRPLIELTCAAYLEANDWLSWYNSTNHVLTTYQQKYDGYGSLKLIWPLALWKKGKVTYCEKETSSKMKSKGKSIPIDFTRVLIPSEDEWGPKILPEVFIENEERFIEFDCWAYIPRWQTLAWYQKKGPNESTLLMVEQKTDYGFVRVKLRKTLVPSDNGTDIFCASGTGKILKHSKCIKLQFQKHVEPLATPYVTVEPRAGVVFFDEDDELEFVCGGSAPVDGRRFTWYLQGNGHRVIPPFQYFYKSTNLNRLLLPVDVYDHGIQLYCAQDFTLNVTKGTSYGELARSKAVTLLHRAQCKPEDPPQVVPEKFEDDGNTYIQFTCYAFLKTRQVLAWYQSKESNKSEKELLRITQFQDAGFGGQWTVLMLNKTLEPADRDSEIYCAKQHVLSDGSLADKLKSMKIQLKFKTDVPSLGPAFITLEPNTTNVSFDVNTTLRVTCGGSTPVDGRAYTWFRIDSESHLTVPDTQKYDASTNQNTLELPLDDSNHMNQLFCSQGFLTYIQDTDGSTRFKFYGELAKTGNITLVQREKDAELASNSCSEENLSNSTILAATIPLVLLALAAAVLALWALRRRRRGRVVARTASHAPLAPPAPPAPIDKDYTDDNFADYMNISRGVATKTTPETQNATPEVTYAELDLPRAAPAHVSPRPARAPETTLYAEIVGVRNR